MKTTKTTKTAQFNIVTGKASIEAIIKSIATRGKSLEKDMHAAAVATLNHAELHGDITLAEKLVQAIPQAARKNALRDWFIAHGKFNYDMKNKTFTYNKAATTQLQQAIDNPFRLFKAEAEYKPFNLEAAVLQLVQRANKAVEKGEAIDTEKLAIIQNLVA